MSWQVGDRAGITIGFGLGKRFIDTAGHDWSKTINRDIKSLPLKTEVLLQNSKFKAADCRRV